MARRTQKAVGHAFTLIEVLIVISIMAALAAILMPVLAAAKLASYKTSSTLNLKQTFAASTLYSNDYDSRVPYAVDDCDWRDLCRSASDPVLWQKIQDNNLPPFSEALQPYGFKRELFKIQAGRGPDYFRTQGTSYVYSLVLSSSPLRPLEEMGCPFFTERAANFWNGGEYVSNIEPGERWLTLSFDGRVSFSLYKGVFGRGDACRASAR